MFASRAASGNYLESRWACSQAGICEAVFVVRAKIEYQSGQICRPQDEAMVADGSRRATRETP